LSALALLLVLLAAVCHASWNLLLKRASGGPTFLWLATLVSALVYAPVALGVYLVQKPHIGLIGLGFIAGTSVLHVIYFLLLAKGYRHGDLSLVYPLARGTGPLVTIVVAVLLLGERPSAVGLAGALMVALGVFLLTGDPRRLRQSGAGSAVVFALLTGMCIAAYTVWDKYAVATLLIPPLIFDWSANACRSLILTPIALREGVSVKSIWAGHRGAVIGVAVLSPLSYILVLTAMVFTPVSYVAPAREISILFAALMGTHFLAEGSSGRRILAACVMVGGVAALAVG
jgi:drug/metabolite transporter (DMT)-like permease